MQIEFNLNPVKRTFDEEMLALNERKRILHPLLDRCSIEFFFCASYLLSGSGCRAATTPPRAAAERLARPAPFAESLCAAGRGATRRSATSSTTLNRYALHAQTAAQAGRFHVENLRLVLSRGYRLAEEPLTWRGGSSMPAVLSANFIA